MRTSPPTKRRRPRRRSASPRRPNTSTVAAAREIPQRQLRNEVSRVLSEVAAGARFVVTVRGQPVAELAPVRQRRVWVPWRDVVEMLRRGPVDERLLSDVDDAVDQSVDDPWTRYSTRPSS